MLSIQPAGIYADATFGGGGHAALILEKLKPEGKLFAFDQDADARMNALKPDFSNNPAFVFIASNFRHLKRQLRSEGVRVGTVNGVLADLGVSSHQFDTADRGFSFRFDAPLDMRMNPTEGPTAADILNTYPVEALHQIMGNYGELRNARTFAQAVVDHRQRSLFATTGQLADFCGQLVIGDRMRYFAQVFQALRMEVNDETGALKELLDNAGEMLTRGGRLVVLTYHSIEDRIVKNYFKAGNDTGIPTKDFYGNIDRPYTLVTKKPIEPSEAEKSTNPRSRSARLRVAVKN
jgi:16S rRNA (cytosine1402-N4)-methyltransferase